MAAQYGSIGPFAPVSIKGQAPVNAVPTFVKGSPYTLGGIAGEDIPFGRVVSIEPGDKRRTFKIGVPTATSVIKGIAMLNPSIMVADPAMNDRYFAGRPMTVTTFGLLDILTYDIAGEAPVEGSTVWVNKTTGELFFNDGTDKSSAGYVKLHATVYETFDPNGAKIFFGWDGLATSVPKETAVKTATPTFDPAAPTVGDTLTVECTDKDARIFMTLDGTAPDMHSALYTTPFKITSAVTVKVIAVKDGLSPSTAASVTVS